MSANFIDALAIGQRNLKPDAKMLIIGRRYNRMKKKQGGDMKSEEAKSKGQNGTSINTAAKLGKEHGVSERTVKRAGEFAEAATMMGAKTFSPWRGPAPVSYQPVGNPHVSLC